MGMNFQFPYYILQQNVIMRILRIYLATHITFYIAPYVNNDDDEYYQNADN